MEFQKWPSIPRLSKETMTITEKIDGSNACIVIVPRDGANDTHPLYSIDVDLGEEQQEPPHLDNVTYDFFAQSRTRFVYPEYDNFGFAAWVYANGPKLLLTLGPGKHYGEWWGSKIQRGYGLKDERRFSLFNVHRWADTIDVYPGSTPVSNLCTVPFLYKGPFDAAMIPLSLEHLRRSGSVAVHRDTPGIAAEGLIVDLREAGARYKVLLENDEVHKWEQTDG